MPHLTWYIAGTGALLLLSVLAGKASSRLGVPALLVFLVIGMLAGSDGPGGFPFDEPAEVQALGVLALIFIMYSGGLETDWSHIRVVVWKGISLATVGVVVSTLLMAAFVHGVLGIAWLEACLLSAMVSSTDAAALFSVLKSQGLALKGDLTPLLEFESGTNDPMAVFLTTCFIQLIRRPDVALLGLAGSLVLEMGVGLLMGVLMGRITAGMLLRLRLPSSGLYPVVSIAMVLLTYGVTVLVHGSGFLAVYVAGMVVGNSSHEWHDYLGPVHDAIAWLMQIAMFFALGLQVFPAQLPPIMSISVVCALFLALVARPAAVFTSLALTPLGWREKVLVSWMGLRGAVPIILATFPLLAGVHEAGTYFNIIFFIVLTSVLAQGTTIPWMARRLGLQGDAGVAAGAAAPT